MSKIRFSIMPCYNSALYLREAVDSILDQTYPDWELLAVNDGSTDETPELLQRYAQKDKRIRVFSKENGGYCSAVNLGLDQVSGDYFLMMGSDDQLFPDLFQKIVEEIGGTLPDMIAFRTVQYVDGLSKGVEGVTDFASKAALFDALVAEYVERYPAQARILFEWDTSKCYKTSLLGDLRLFGKYGYDADGIFATLFAHKARSFMSIPLDGYRWTLRADSVSAATSLPKNLDRLRDWKRFFEANQALPCEEVTQYEIRYAKHFVRLAQNTALTIPVRDTEAIEELRQSIACIPDILDRYDIKDGAGSRWELLLLTRFPRLWISYRKTRSFVGRKLRGR